MFDIEYIVPKFTPIVKGEVMKTEKNIFIAFVLNLAFSIFEFFGGIFTGSVAILSDALHDIGDAASIGVSFFLEKKSKKSPDEKYTYGYVRYSALGGIITTLILLIGSIAVLCGAINRLFRPTEIRYNGMIIFAVVGVFINVFAAFLTRDGETLNQRAVNLHMLEDVLGWVVVLVGAVVMRFTDFVWIDPIMSIGVALFIFLNAAKNLKEGIDLFLEKTPCDVDILAMQTHLCKIDGVIDVHHLHVWSLDGQNHCATLHVVSNGDPHEIKKQVREELAEHGISHATLELETQNEPCLETECHRHAAKCCAHHHHHHHH